MPLHGRKALVGLDRRAVVRDQPGADAKLFGRSLPPAQLGRLHAGVVGLAVVEIRHAEGPLAADRPLRVGAEDFGGAVGILQSQLQKQCLAVAVVPVFAGVEIRAHRPAAADVDQKLVLARQGVCDLIALVRKLAAVARKARGEIAIAHLFAVELQLIHAKGGGIDPGAGDGLARREDAAEAHRLGRDLLFGEAVVGVGDPHGLPGGVQPPGLKVQLAAGGVAGLRGELKHGGIRGKGLERRAAVGNGDLIQRVSLPVPHPQGGGRQTVARAVGVGAEAEAGTGIVRNTATDQAFNGKASDGKHAVSPYRSDLGRCPGIWPVSSPAAAARSRRQAGSSPRRRCRGPRQSRAWRCGTPPSRPGCSGL